MKHVIRYYWVLGQLKMCMRSNPNISFSKVFLAILWFWLSLVTILPLNKSYALSPSTVFWAAEAVSISPMKGPSAWQSNPRGGINGQWGAARSSLSQRAPHGTFGKYWVWVSYRLGVCVYWERNLKVKVKI